MRGKMPKQEPPGEAPDASVTGSQGVQVGTGNNQYNNWAPKPPLDPAAVRDVSPHVAVTWLQELEPRELVKFFAGATPDDVGEIIAAFLEVDKAKIVATLGDINHRKATELIATVCVDALLMALPGAAQEIARKAASLKWTDAGPLVILMGEYARKYNSGHVLWSQSSGVTATTGEIDAYYWTPDADDCGFPVMDQEAAPTSPYGTTGTRQEFQAGTLYSSKHSVFLISDDKCYQSEGGSGGWLGFPVSRMLRSENPGERQVFEGGAICSFIVDGPDFLESFAVRQKVIDLFPAKKGWMPVSKEIPVVSSSGGSGTCQVFRCKLGSDVYETAAYRLDQRDLPVMVAPEVWDYYDKLGAEKSWLGFPATRRTASSRGSKGYQGFEGGGILWELGISPIAIPAASLAFIRERSLGFPVSEEQPAGADGTWRIQFFQNGVVTMRDGEYEVWVRPEPKPDPGSKPESPAGKADQAGGASEPTSARQPWDSYLADPENYRLPYGGKGN